MADDLSKSPTTPQNEWHATHPALLNAMVATAMDAILAIDEEQHIVLFNAAAERMFACPAEEAIGSPLSRFLPERHHASHGQYVAGFMTTGQTWRAMGHLRPLAARRDDGVEFPIEATISQVTIDGRQFGAAIVRDISARQASDEARRRQAELLDLANDAIFTWDWDGTISYWNRGAERLYGFARDRTLGRNVHDLLRTRHQESIGALLEQLERDGVWEGELIHARSDGLLLTVESRHVLVREDDRAYVLEVTRDISARKQAERERAASLARETATRAEAIAVSSERDRLRQILDGLPSGVFIVSIPDGGIEFANATFSSWLAADSAAVDAIPVYGRDFIFLRADGVSLSTIDRPGMRALRGEPVRGQQLLLQRSGGGRIPVSAHASPLRDSDGQIRHAIVVIQDETRAREAEQLKDDFLALISHEFRTPLTAIHGGAHLLANATESLDPEAKSELLQDVVNESERLDRMLANILMLANVLGGRLRVQTEPVLVGPIVNRVSTEVAKRAQSHQFIVRLPTVMAPIEADPDLLEEVLRNLYENAVKYAPQGGAIVTSEETGDDTIALRITDEGIGIAPEHVGSVFERFRRVGGDPTVRGMGLGLYLSRHLVEVQGGRIDVHSPGLGLGTTFSVVLPIASGWNPSEDGV